MIRFFIVFFLFLASSLQAETMKMAVTTSFHNSGLSDVLLPAIQNDTGIDVQLLVVGTGQALRLGRSGDVDAILVHSRAAEEAFVDDGFGMYRREIMYNDFVIVGPSEDPAGVGTSTTVLEALDAIATQRSAFVSRGDDSGTHKKELSLWASAGIDPVEFGDWYSSVGAGMGASLNTASGLNAYILTDRASWLNFGNAGDLVLLLEGDDVLFNQYAYLPVSPIIHSHVSYTAAQRLEAWLTSQRASDLINGYTIGGETLFVFNAN